MFFNPGDVKYFKPVEIRTRLGLRVRVWIFRVKLKSLWVHTDWWNVSSVTQSNKTTQFAWTCTGECTLPPISDLLLFLCYLNTSSTLDFLLSEDVIESTNSQGWIILLLWLTSSTKPPIRGSPISTRCRPHTGGGTLSISRLTMTGPININTLSRRKLKLSPHSSSTRKLIKNPTARSSRPEGSPSTRARPSFTRPPSVLPRGRIGLRANRSPDLGANSWKGAK